MYCDKHIKNLSLERVRRKKEKKKFIYMSIV